MKQKVEWGKTIKTAHLIGIGGSGMSAIAQYFLSENIKVSGSEINDSPALKELLKMGANISLGQSSKSIPENADLIVYSSAVIDYEPELLTELKKTKIPAVSYHEALGLVSKDKKVIAVAGTHGKTTTTAMIAKIMVDCGFDPTIFAGGILKDINSNFRRGRNDWFVVEADEYRRGFLNLSPDILVITNIDADHIGYYKDLADIQEAFADFIRLVKKNGTIVTDTRLPNLTPVLQEARETVRDYPSIKLEKNEISFQGNHNISNAKAALLATCFAGADEKIARQSLRNFSGVKRRFDLVGKSKEGFFVYDDYAHNPQKVRAALLGFREKHPRSKIYAIFQPHLFSRTKYFLKDFASSLCLADEALILPIYPSREKFDPTVSSDDLAREIKNKKGKTSCFPDFNSVISYARKTAEKDDVVAVIGAGDVTNIAKFLVELIK